MQYQIRRGGQIGPSSYSIDQLKQMYASGSLVLTDEVSPEGHNQWKPLSQAFKGGQAAAAQVAPPLGGADWLMPASIILWVFRGCLMGAVLSTVLPWFSASASSSGMGDSFGFSASVTGLLTAPGIMVFLLAGATLGLTWVAVVRPWTFTGAAGALFMAMLAVFGVFGGGGGSSSFSAAGQGFRSSASFGAGFGAWLALLTLIAATTFGVFAFVQHQKKMPEWT
ncbi:MAG: DUF4339 domain-containing protein [Phycisphaerales bacterium]|nr:DUF4339 domain-containing protein [Phycisphaerales bacterium]